jgi:hypothetical protein
VPLVGVEWRYQRGQLVTRHNRRRQATDGTLHIDHIGIEYLSTVGGGALGEGDSD